MHLIFPTKEAYAKPISLICYYTNTPILRPKNPGLMSLTESWKRCVFNTETMECLTTVTCVNLSSKCIPYIQAAFSVVAFLYETNYVGVLAICHAVVYKEKCWCYWQLMQVRDISR